MRIRGMVITGAALAAVLAGSILVAAQQPFGRTASAPTAAPPPTVAPPTPGAPATSGAPVPETQPGSTPAVPSPDPPGGALPESKPLLDLLTLPLPATASAIGAMVAGFPTAVIPTAPDSIIGSSAVASAGTHLQVALTATTTLTAGDIVAFYRTAFAPYGLVDAPSPSLGDSSALSFSRGNNSVSLTVTGDAGGSSYIVFAALTAPS